MLFSSIPSILKEKQKTVLSIVVIVVTVVISYSMYMYILKTKEPQPLTREEKLELLEGLSKQSKPATASSTAAKGTMLQQLNKTQPKQTATTTQVVHDKKMELLKSLQQPQP